MNARTLKRLGIALAVLVVAWVALGLARRASRDRERRLALVPFDPAVADHAMLIRDADSLRFVRVGAGWTVNGHRANAGLVGDLLHGLADTAAPSELAAENASSHQPMGLDSGQAWRVSALLGERTLAALLVGHRGDPYGSVYVRKPGENAAYLLTQSQLADLTERADDDWRDKAIAKVAPESVWTVEVQRGKRGYTLTRGSSGWSLGHGGADSAAVAGLLARFRDLEAVGFATPAQADSARRARTSREVTLEAKGGRALLVLRMDSTTAGYWTRPEGDSTTYRLDGWTVDQLAP
ncbi:MAG: hypothetical protein B7Z72_11550, partial [Gemmatimonadetes bacterium 21-71-4]